ncbi:hypothetical protein D770_12230 [Flammeovirgaceae bacterium 311]|nr:hypothetical protein D770_12230 [Flammeovirgaceae bacterium 311]
MPSLLLAAALVGIGLLELLSTAGASQRLGAPGEPQKILLAIGLKTVLASTVELTLLLRQTTRPGRGR